MNNIKELRKKFGLSQVQLADAINVHQTSVSQWETERTNPDMSTLKALAALFDVTTDYLLGRDENKKPTTPKGDGQDSEVYEMLNRLSNEQLEDAKKYLRFLESQGDNS